MRISLIHVLVLVLIIVVLFGASRLPGVARNLGKSMRIMKEEVRGLHDDPAPTSTTDAPGPDSDRPPAP